MFLQKVDALLNGEDGFYENIFADLEIPYEPFPYGEDKYEGQLSGRANSLEQDRRAIAVWRLINMYRMRGHVLANLDPDRKSTRLNSSHVAISYAVFCLKKKKK